jgi:hypothetical protein
MPTAIPLQKTSFIPRLPQHTSTPKLKRLNHQTENFELQKIADQDIQQIESVLNKNLFDGNESYQKNYLKIEA